MKGNAWASKVGFILAAAGSAIGLGAIWKFSYTTGTNGGGAFLLLFLVFLVALFLQRHRRLGLNLYHSWFYRSVNDNG